MTNLLYFAPRTYSYNMACDVVEKLYNPNYKPLDDCLDSPVTHTHINDSVTYYFVNGDLVAVYDEASGNLLTTIEM